MAAEAEAALNALKKREANKSCVNCGNYNKFGHQNVCEKPRTFVCSNCKSAHQSFSMRVKSVSMSNWTMAEVDALRDENGGGNAAAARVWLARWDETQMRKPTAQDPLDYYKQFINRVYNDKAFYDEAGAGSSSAPPAAERSPSRSPEGRRAAPAPAVDLLGFDAAPAAAKQPEVASFDAFSGSQWTANNSSNAADWGNFAAAPVAPHSSPNDGFAAFGSAPAPSDGFANFSAAPAATPTPAASTEVFGAFASAPVAPSTPSFDPFAAPGGGLLAPTAPSSGGFGSVAPTPAPFDPFAPVAGSSGKSTANGFGQFQSAAPKDFAAFDGLSAPSLAYGAPQNSAGNGYGQHHNGMGMQGHGQRMQPHAPGFQQPHYPPQQQQQQYHPQMMGGGNAAMNISTFFAPNGVAVGGGNAGPRQNGRDPFAGLGLPQH
ncbi:hypothetical protein BBJ28_00016372 [Nothophytophthora sp. Chile5]|nr:hypothetical protein BBJ28_00016372 [Nothophytophthora sp. Chile5]